MTAISFMGAKDTIAKTTKQRAGEYFSSKTPIGEIKTAAKDAYEVSKKDLESYVASHKPLSNENLNEVPADKLAEAYKAAHGIQ